MLKAHLLHNPSAGDEDHSEKDLLKVIQSHGFTCRYSSTKKNIWKDIEDDTDFLIIAGGDGTIRKIAREILDSGKIKPIAILPKGTANNIAKTLNISGTNEEIIESWKEKRLKKFSIGSISNFPASDFFLEGLGYGLFPKLISEMQIQGKDDIENPEERIKAAWELLHDLAGSMKAFRCTAAQDGTTVTGDYLMVEVMNIKSIGPNLILAPGADTADAIFELVMVPESDRDQLTNYIYTRMKNGSGNGFEFPVTRSRSIVLSSESELFHADDEMHTLKRATEIEVSMKGLAFEFLV